MLAFVLSFAVYIDLSSPITLSEIGSTFFPFLGLSVAMKVPVRKDVGWGSCERLLDGYVSAEGKMFYCYMQLLVFGVSA
jgi:hypothetical protein